MTGPPKPPRGRGAVSNPLGRFERLEIETVGAPPERVETRFLRDTSRSVIARNESPDVDFDASINPYRGCEHGCAYCYARTTHEYLGFSAGLDFETRILVKENAPELLAHELAAPGWEPQVLGLSGVTDPYQPVERELRITRGILEVLAEARHPCTLVTKSTMILRDLDLLAPMARDGLVSAFLSVTTLDRGVFLNLGSAVIIPEVFVKALNLARNLGHTVERVTAINMDFIRHYRPGVNVLDRPTADGGRAIQLTGHHEIMFPLLFASVLEELG